MNRQIKFRFWDVENNKFWFSETLQSLTLLSEKIGKPYNQLVVQQYTGLKDKNNKEIYEGDIVCENHDEEVGESNIGIIYFVAGTFMIDGDGPLYDHTYSLTPDILEDYKVIGNIFENPELLK